MSGPYYHARWILNPDPKNIEAITLLDNRLYTREQMDTFIGIMGYSRDYMSSLAEIIAPLADLCKTTYNLDL